MRIGVDATPLLGERTGIGWYTHDLIDAVAARSPDDSIAAFPISWRTARVLEAPARPNLEVVRRFAPARPLWAMWDRVPFPPLEWFVRCDVFHATNYVSPPSRHTPTVVTVHDIGFIQSPDEVSPATARMGRLLPKVLRRAAAVIVVSEFTRGELVAWLPEVADRTTVVANGSHRHRQPSGTTPSDPATPTGDASAAQGRDRDPYALVIGSLEPRKNIGLALDALVILKRRGSRLKLVLAGGATPRLDVDALIRERDLGPDDVALTGYLDDSRMGPLLAGARMLAFPSRYEGFGMPVIEAMAAGVPVVAARAGALPETAGNAAVLIDPDDTEGFAGAMATLDDDEGLRTRLVDAGRARAALYTWDRAAEATLAVYRNVI